MLLSPKNLWHGYDREIMPLDCDEIYSVETSFGMEKGVYFNGEASALGCTRIFARHLVHDGNDGRAVIVLLSPQHDITKIDFSALTDKGYSVIAVDYAGNVPDKTRFTIYPRALEFANYDSEKLYSTDCNPQKSCWYVWTTVCMRAVTFAQKAGYGKVALIGEGIGGAHVIKTAALSDFPVCAVTLFSPGFFPESDNPDSLAVSVSNDVTGYASMMKIPVLHICCSNDSDESLDEISTITEQAAGKNSHLKLRDNYIPAQDDEQKAVKSLLYIAPRMNKAFTEDMADNIDYFVSRYLNLPQSSERKELFEPINLTASGNESKLYFSFKTNIKSKEATLYIAHEITNPAYRNWHSSKMEKVGEDEYMGYTDVYYADKNVYAFVTLKTEDGFSYCSPVMRKIPSSLGLMPISIYKHRLIYESDMGVDDFFSEGNSKPVIKKGPFDIDGVCEKTLCTYKLGDSVFSGERDSVLQLLLFSSVSQQVTFSVADKDNFNIFVCTKTVSPQDDWVKLSLSANDFKSKDSTLGSWDKIIFLKISASEEIIVSSLLWV